MRRILLVGLMAAVLPVFSQAKDGDLTVPVSHRLHILENKGQVKDQFNNPRNDIQFSIPGKGISVFGGNGQLHYQFYHAKNQQPAAQKKISIADLGKENATVQYDMFRMDVELVGANKNAQMIKEDQQEFVERYYTINAADRNINTKNSKKEKEGIEVHSYNKVTYKNIYPNIDWVLFVKDNQVEYEFVVRPGGNPADIKIKYTGARSLKTNEDGSLTATTPLGTITEAAPYSYQQDGKVVNSSYNLVDNVLSFNIDSYTGTLVIDPVLAWGTYYGSTGGEEYNSVAYDGTGNIYATGSTTSPGNIATVGADQTLFGGADDIFISKFTSAGALVWTTYNGGTGSESGVYVTYDAFSGSPYIAGFSNAFTLIDNDLYICQYTAAGVFVWDFLYGDVGDDVATCVKCDAAGNQYVAGYTNSTTGLTTVGVVQTTNLGGYDGLITKFNAAGTVTWSTYYGGSGTDLLNYAGVDGAGNVYAAGSTNSTTSIATLNSYAGGASDAFIAKLNSTATLWTWGLYYGGSGDDECNAADVETSGNIYMTGYTTTPSGLATTGAFQTTYGGSNDAFVSRHSQLGGLLWSSYYGGPGGENGFAIHYNGSNIFVGGYTTSGSGMNTSGGFQPTFGGTGDGFLAKIGLGGAFAWGTYYGGSGDDAINGVISDGAQAIFVDGITNSANNIAINTTVQSTISSGLDAFISRINDCNPPGQPGLITGTFTVCAGSSQTYSIAPVAGATSYTWTLPGGWTGTSTTTSITVTVGTTGGSISVTPVNACGNGPAQTQTVTVNPLPTASITAGGPTTFCQPGSVTLSATTGTGYTYQWYQGAPIPGANAATYNATATGNYHVVVTLNGCTATSNTISVTANPTPAVPTVGSNSPVCVGATLNLTSSTTTSGVTYAWQGPNTFISSIQNPVINNVTLAAAGTYTVTVTANGCSSTGTTTVVVNAGAPVQPGTISGSISVCAGSSQTYSIAAVPGATSYTWTLPGGWTGTSTSTSINATVGTTGGNITVTATNNCGTSTAQTLAVTVNPAPAATITPAGPATFCQGGSVVLDANTGTGFTYQWYNGTTAIAGATNASYTANASGSYTVVVTANGCSATSAAVTVTVNPLPNPVITQSGLTLTCNPAFTSYQWYDGNGQIAGATSQSYTATVDGTYYVIVTDANGCTNQSNSIQLMLSVNDVNGASLVSLYPNPNNGSFTINGTFAANDGKVNVAIVDIAGRIVHTQQVTLKGNVLSAVINMNNSLAAGVYTLKLSSDIQNGTIPFVKK